MQQRASIVFNYPKEISSLKIFKVKTSSKKILARPGPCRMQSLDYNHADQKDRGFYTDHHFALHSHEYTIG